MPIRIEKNYMLYICINYLYIMTLQQLEYLVALDDHRHFVKAAESCFVTQPTLTMQLKKLEDEIGLQLIDRQKKPLRPTAAGEQIIRKARQIIGEVGDLKAFVSNETEEFDGEFTLAVIPTLAPYILPLFLPSFIQDFPSTKLVIQEMQTSQILEALQKGSLDMGLLVTPLEEKHIREIPLFHESFCLYLPKNHPLQKEKKISSKSLDSEAMLFLEEGHCFRDQALSICSRRSKKNLHAFEYRSGSIETLKSLVRENLGYTLVPKLSVLHDLKDKHVKEFIDPVPVREVSLAVHKNFSKEALIEAVRDSILKSLPKDFNQVQTFTRVKWR
jgi:LysR family hydrogen peroxide-inducible transcriptional activator